MDSIVQQWLSPLLASSQSTLWVVDEHFAELNLHIGANTQAITNRFDTAEALKSHLPVVFNDFDFGALKTQKFEQIVYRISKEKPLAHHVINSAADLLSETGELHLLGGKGEGIKGYIDRTAKFFGTQKNSEKLAGDIWSASLSIDKSALDSSKQLDDKNYPVLRPSIADDTTEFMSKPGVFGWNKIDAGSAYLVDNIDLFLNNKTHQFELALDLGCGYGYLAAKLSTRYSAVTATDNNAAALNAAERNVSLLGIQGKVVASDAGDSLTPRSFDLILCNPPFHSGFDTNSALTEKFAANAARLLSPQGVACFVTNLHIPLERIASSHFANVEVVASNKHFKLVRLMQPKS